MTKPFYTATASSGELLEYRESPLYTIGKHVNKWMTMPAFVRVWLRLHMLQRRINGGRWITIGGYMHGKYYLRKGVA